jgi:hypothetical protein
MRGLVEIDKSAPPTPPGDFDRMFEAVGIGERDPAGTNARIVTWTH